MKFAIAFASLLTAAASAPPLPPSAPSYHPPPRSYRVPGFVDEQYGSYSGRELYAGWTRYLQDRIIEAGSEAVLQSEPPGEGLSIRRSSPIGPAVGQSPFYLFDEVCSQSENDCFQRLRYVRDAWADSLHSEIVAWSFDGDAFAAAFDSAGGYRGWADYHTIETTQALADILAFIADETRVYTLTEAECPAIANWHSFVSSNGERTEADWQALTLSIHSCLLDAGIVN